MGAGLNNKSRHRRGKTKRDRVWQEMYKCGCAPQPNQLAQKEGRSTWRKFWAEQKKNYSEQIRKQKNNKRNTIKKQNMACKSGKNHVGEFHRILF